MLKETFEQLREESDVDALTGLKNRRAFEREVNRLIREQQGGGDQNALIIADVDQFNMINDLCGVEGGDHLLSTLASIIDNYLNRPALVARTGDDEFGILIEHCSGEEAYLIASNQRCAIENLKYRYEGVSVGVSASFGVAEIDQTMASAAEAMQAAYSCCLLAKEKGRNAVHAYHLDDEEAAQRSLLIHSVPRIERALEKNQLLLYCQPIAPVYLMDTSEEHYEVLLRVIDEQRRVRPPVEFIDVAERSGRMRAVDRWVINTFYSELDKIGSMQGVPRFSVNLSGESIGDEGFIAFLLERLDRSPRCAGYVAFEITETAFVKDMERVKTHIRAIKARGCSVYLDDFGSGYASYSYLKDLPVDCVKIDGVFVRNITEDPSSFAMVRSIVEVAHLMDKQVIAEFVENEATLVSLQELDVDFAQGRAIGEPIPLHKVLPPQ
ncbi:MAG: hypothetical protein B0D96_00595 [Candidatus Sedimenticola endophacoides]|uniref:Diguanylate cyclase n=1 Tax=Candidatus Sedimenticola endophacoides TaxID=2548426 RepID=A0A657PZG4_9GAMM|nr:MAG: hypothetical protein B0D94_11355 [Candidatus Sedimenticola endophacoides]OQX38231.1 MAG: hypothetical protein B0D96_00595 [Candidatus Sedimenticola endophacoides]OQX38673.1 MAG: hypothetical protein B0D89_12290 [Candidatus Sedimenticola endophacoides]OQX45893.1 MAG: hypothetical protein B0D86_02675 [Candidatus Sedimenticola endophacoides]OQX48821.1 MAG: hypothetical protein B0D87_03680 [Candidatus Sedimenticola endophacoides]